MKNRPNKIARTAFRRGRFALHPLSFAICLGLSGGAWALPQGGKVVAGDATISTPSTTTEIIRQTTDKAIIDWKSFSIAAGEKVRFYQPSSTSVTLNRVTGYDPSYILGQMSSNGKIFLLNPYGVVFGAGARVDVGGLVASTLSMSNNDFLASRYSLTSVDPAAPAQRGAVVNEGTISSPGGVVVLAAPSVTNSGTIVANGGRVGLVAANSVSVDVEGDGLLFFQTSATEAKNRLAQLGHIQADGGSVELRAAARGAFADTVLNMTGVVQAKTIGTREGRIVIDGGSEGLTAVSGQLDATGLAAGERGGAVTVQGQYLLLDKGSRIDASGDAGGGAIRVGGDFHGANPDIRDAEKTIVAPGAELHADAITNGNGGSLVVWANDWTRYYGNASIKGGAQGGNGGAAEVSGKQSLDYSGFVDARAPYGSVGTLLMDPTNFTIQTLGGDSGTLVLASNAYTDPTTVNSNITPATLVLQLNGASTTVDTTSALAGTGTITVVDPVHWNSLFNLTLQADSTITVNAAGLITNDKKGDLNLFTNGGVVLNGAVSLGGGNFIVRDKTGGLTAPALSFTAGAGATITTTGAAGQTGGNVDILTSGAIVTQALTTSGGTSAAAGKAAGGIALISNGGAVTVSGAITALGGAAAGASNNGGAGGNVQITANGLATVSGNITTTGGAKTGAGTKGPGGVISVQGNGVSVAAGGTLDADDAVIAINGSGGAIQLNTSTLTTTSNAANALIVHNATTVGLGNLTATGTTTLGVAGDITGAVTQAGVITTGTLIGNTAGSVTLGGANAAPTLGAFTTNGAFTFNEAGALNVTGAVTTQNNGLASITATGGSLTIAGTASVAGAGVTLASTGAGNNLTLNGPVNGNAGTVTLDSGNNIGQAAAGTITTTGALTIAAPSGTITLDKNNAIGSLGTVTRGGAFTLNDTGGGLTLTGDVGADASAVSITTAGGALALGTHTISATGAGGDVTLTGVGVTQTTGSVLAGGAAQVNAGAGVIDLQSLANDFVGVVTLNATGASAAVADANNLSLATPTLGANTGLTAIATGKLTLPGGLNLNTGSGTIDLESQGSTLATTGTLTTNGAQVTLVGRAGLTITDDITTSGGNVSLTGGGAGAAVTGTNNKTVDAGSGTIAIDGGGGIGATIDLKKSTLTTTNSSAAAVTIRNATTVTLGNITANSGTVQLGVAGDVSGLVSQTASTTLSADTLAASTAGVITLGTGSTTLTINNLGDIRRGGALTIKDSGGGLTLTGDITTGATNNALSITTAGGALNLGAHNITTTTAAGDLALTGVGVSQTVLGTLLVGGKTTVDAGAGSIDLQSPTNHFTGIVDLTATGSAAIRDAAALQLNSFSGNGITAIAGTTLALPGGAITTTGGAINLQALGGALTTTGTLTSGGGGITLVGTTGLTVNNDVVSGGGSISLTGGGATGLVVTAAHNVNAGAGTIALDGGSAVSPIALNASTLTTTNNTAGAVTIHDAAAVTLGNVTATSGTVQVGVAGDVQGAVTQTGGTTLAANTLAASTSTGASAIDLGSAGTLTINNLGTVDRGGALTINDSAGGLTLTGDITSAASSVSITTATGPLALGTHNITATGAGTLTLNGVGVTQTTGALAVVGTTSVNGGTGSIGLQSANNDFGNTVTLVSTGPNVALHDTNNLTLGSLAGVGGASNLTVTAGSTLTLPAAAFTTTGTIDLQSQGGTLATNGALTGNSISLTGSTGLTIGHALSATTVALNSTNNTINEVAGGTITATGATTFNAGSGAVTLNQGNTLASIGGTGGAVSITETSVNGVALDTINANSLTVDTSAAGGTVSQTALRTLTVTGATSINAGAAGTVTLTNAGNNFGSFGATGGAVSVTDSNAIALDATTATSLTVDTSAGNGAVTQNAALNVTNALTVNAGTGAITLGSANTLGSFGATGGAVSLTEGSANGVALDNVNSTGLSVDTSVAGGNVSQTAAKTLIVTGATAVNAGVGTVVLANNGNNFGSFGATGTVISVRDINALALDAINATTLTVDTSTGNGVVTQNAAAVVTGPTVVTSGAGAITLNNAGNDFSNAAGNSFTGGAISLRDSNDLKVTSLSPGPNQAVTVVAGLGLTLPASGLNTGTADITLSSGAALTTPGTLTGNNVSLNGTAGVTIANDINAAGNLTLTSANTAINQTNGKISAGGLTTVTAGTGAVTLAQPLDDFNSINVVSGGNVNVNDANALTASAIAGGALTITSTGVLTSGGTLSGTNVTLAGSGGINLANNVTATGTLQLTSTNSAITQSAGAITATGGLTTVNAGSGDVTLTQVGNDFSNASGIAVTGGATRITDANTLFISSLSTAPNKDLSLIAVTGSIGGALVSPIDTGTADLTISAGAGFTTFASLRGTNVTLGGGGVVGISIGHNVTALGNLTLNAANAPITQTAGTITAAGTTTATAGTGSISLALAGNDFATFVATGNAITVRDDNGLVLGPINATTLTLDTSAGNGAVTQSGAAVVTGATTITAGSGAVTLTNANNDFANIGVTGGAVSITDLNAVALNAINATALTVNTSTGNGNVTQNAAAVVTGATAVNAGTGTVTLSNAGNDFGSVGATGSTVSVTDINALALDAINTTTLTLNAGGAITQNAAAVVGGVTTANAGANAITLNNAGNNFGSVGATGGAVSITDVNALALDAINANSLTINTAAGNGNVTQNAAAIVAGATTVNAGTGAVTLANAGNNFGSVAAIGGAVSITDINAVSLGAINATTLTVDASAGNGAVTQTGAAVVTGASNVNAGTGAITLGNAGNDFATLGLTGGAISVVDANALTLSSLASSPNQAVNVNAGGALTLPASAIDTGTANLTLTSGGTLTTIGTLRGTNVALTSGGAMTLANNITALGTLGLTATNSPIQQTGGTILATGTATVNAGTGDITLTQPSNNFQGNVLLSGGAVSVRDFDNLTVTSLVSGANRPVSLIAGGSLALPAAPIDTGTADLTLQALGGSLAINGALNGNNVTLTGTTGLTLGANITSSGAQIYTSQVQLSGNVALNSGASKIDLQGGANGGGNNLSLTSSNVAADAIHTGAAINNTVQFTVTGNSTLGGNVTTTGTQTYTGPIVLGADVALASGAAKIDLQGAVNAAGHNLALTSSNAAADAIRASAAITNAAQFTVTGKSTLASGVTTTGTQLYTDTVTLGSNSNFVGSGLSFGNGIVAATFDIGLQSDALALVGTVTGSGNATVSSLTQNASVGVAGGAGAYQISQATLDKFATFGSLTVGRADGTGDLTFGNLSLPTNFAVQSASGNANFTGTVSSAAGQARNLTVTTGGTTTFAGAVGGAIGGPIALGNLSVAGATDLNASTTTTGSQSFGGPVTIGANATLSASAVSFASSLDVGTQSVTILGDALSVAGPATGSGAGNIRVAPNVASGSIGVAGGAGTLQVSQGLIDTLAGIPTLTLGRVDSTAVVNVGNVVLPADLTITNGSGSVALAGTVDSAAGPARNLSVTTTGVTSFTGAVGSTRAVNALTVSGASQLGTTITTSGAQTYTGAATLVADSTLSGPTVSFGSTVDGAHALTVNGAATNFTGAVGSTTALTSLTTDAAGTTQLGGNVTTTGAQTYNDALQLNGNTVLAGSTLNLAGSVDGAHTLAINGSTGVTLGSAIGAGTALTSLSTSGPLQLNAGAVTTTGSQSYAGKTTLGAATALTASSIAFGNTVDGAFGLTLQSPGTTSFAGAVGATTALASLSANGGGTVQLAGPSIDTTGAQSYSGALQLAGITRLAGSALTLTGPVTGASDLTLQTNALNGGTSIAGTGVLTIAPVDPTLSTGVAGGAGALQVSQAVLNGATGFTSHVIGRSDGSGIVSAGNLVLRADTTFQTATGDVNLGGSVDGAFALTLNSGGTTRITGPVGVTTALKNLVTDNNTSAADWNGTTGERTTFDTADGTGAARVITTGAQTYNDPVTATVPVAFTGGAITATQATNRFDGKVAANASSLDLRSSTDLLLGGVTLQNGGSIVTDGVLHLTGALQLNGGTLILTSNATPTPIDLTDPEYAGKTLSFGFVPIKEASATIVQDPGATLSSTAGTLLVLRSPAGGSLLLDQPGNTLLGQISAVSGSLGDTNQARFSNATTTITLGLIRIASSQINVAGAPPTNGDQTVTQAGLEGDVIKLTADVLTTGPQSLIRARLPFNNLQGSQTSLPALTFALSPTALLNGGGFGSSATDTFIQVQVGGSEGGFITARPKGTSGNTAVIFLGGDAQVRPFYDGTGKITEIRIFYNGDAPRTPQEAGALAAVIALIEEARHARFDEAVRTENVSSRLRSGVIAEVGAGRPATVGRESIRLPDTCEIKPKTLRCE